MNDFDSPDPEFSELWFSRVLKLIDFSNFEKWSELTKNPNVTPELIKKYNSLNPKDSKIKWSYVGASLNPNFTMKDIVEIFSLNPNIAHETYNSENVNYYKCLVRCQNLDWNLIREAILSPNPNFGLIIIDFYTLSMNPCITWENIQDSISLRPEVKDLWDFDILSLNKNISWEIIENNIHDYSWSFEKLSKRKDINLKFVNDHPEFSWNYQFLSKNSNITWEKIQSFPNIPWSWVCISQNPNITWEDVKASGALNSNLTPWNWNFLSMNPNITWDIIKENLDSLNSKNLIPWNWRFLLVNPNITWEIVKENFFPLYQNEYPISWYILNPNITLDVFNMLKTRDPGFVSQFSLGLYNNHNLKWQIIKSSKILSSDKSFSIIENEIQEKSVQDLPYIEHILYDFPFSPLVVKWKSEFIQERNQKRCAIIKDELLKKTYQAGYFFKNCLSEAERKELGFDEEFLREATEKYPVKF